MEELELRQYWEVIRKRMFLVFLIPILAAIISAVLSFFVIKPQYEANTTLLVNQKPENNTALQYQAIIADQAMVKTYSDIIKSTTIEQGVVSNLHLPYTTKQLDGMVSVSSPDQSQVIQVKVVAPSESEAVSIANSIAGVFQSKAESLMDVKNVQIVDPAMQSADSSPVKPNKKLNIAIAVVLGLMVSIGLAFLLEYLDNRLRTEEDVLRHLKVPVLGNIVEYSEMD